MVYNKGAFMDLRWVGLHLESLYDLIWVVYNK